MTAASVPAAPSMFAVFRKRDFSLLWTAQLISTAGSALTDLAAGIYVFRVTGSALAVGLTLMVTAIPSLIVGLLAGVYVDRHDRKTIMIATCLIQAVAVGLIAVVLGIEAIAVPGLYLLLLVNAGIKQFFDPAHDSLIPELATDDELAAANSFLSIASFGSTAIGFAGAGLLASFRPATGLRDRRRVVRRRGVAHRVDGALHATDPRGRGVRGGDRLEPAIRPRDAVRYAGAALAVPPRLDRVLLVRALERAPPADVAPRAPTRRSSSTGSRRA